MGRVWKYVIIPMLFSLIFGSVTSSVTAVSIPKREKHRFRQTIDWNTTATEHQGELDQDFIYDCPPHGDLGRVWGTDIYTSDSSICTAAVHAGLITPRHGGIVKIRIISGASSYLGTSRNGVTTDDWGSYSGSFIFTDRITDYSVDDSSVATIDWNTNASEHQGQLDQDFSYYCLPHGEITIAWGTDIYTSDSSICTAAVHAGLITPRHGGIVTIRIIPGASSYLSTTRNGVTTGAWGNYLGSFIFVNSIP